MAELRVHSLIDTKTKTVSLTGNNTVLIRNHSTAEIVLEAVGVVNLDTVRIVNGSASEWGTVTEDGYIRATFPNVEADTFSVTAEDEYGRYIRKDAVANMIDYINLTCNALNMRPDASGNISLYCYGDYFNGNFGKVANTLTVQYRYRIAGGSWSSYNSMTVGVTGNGYTAQKNLTGLNYEATYEFEYRAADQLMTVDTALSGVTTLPVFHWGANDFAFEVPVDFNSKGVTGLKINDYLAFANATSMIIARSTVELEIYAPILDIRGAILKQNGQEVSFAEHGTWTPYLSCSGVYLSQHGWYSKAGNTVTVGFHIKMYCDSGSENYNIVISGLPYTPAFAAAGGGMLSGALVMTGKNFQCFVAETNGTITTRAQACDYTSGTNLETSASAFFYSSTGELTLSGTITYMTA
jgi:hypothetical protein